MFEISRLGAIGVFQNKNDGSDVLSKCNTIISNYKNSFKSFFLPSIVFLSEISKNSNLVHLHPYGRLCHIWKSVRIMLAVGQIVVCTILKDILMLYSFPMHPSNTPNAKKLGFDPPNGGKRGILPLSFKNLKIPLGCFRVLVCGPDWAQPTWRWALVMIGP